MRRLVSSFDAPLSTAHERTAPWRDAHFGPALLLAGFVALFSTGRAEPAPSAPPTKVITVSGEVVDTWCNVSGLMYGLGTAHRQCAVWCTMGGIPVSIRDEAGAFFLILRVEGDGFNAANPRLAQFQGHQVEVRGEVLERDGVTYLLVDAILDDAGVINETHGTYGIQPFGF